MKRVSVTTLEKFRRFIAGASEWDTEASVIEALQGKFQGNPKTRFGSNYHEVCEGAVHFAPDNRLKSKDLFFTLDQARPGIMYFQKSDLWVFEHPISDVYNDFQITARIDVIDGLNIRDVKTKFSHIDWSDYAASCQWKFYLDMMEAKNFYYDVFQVKGFPDDATMTDTSYPTVKIMEVESMLMQAYDGMSEELYQLVKEFKDFITDRNLWHLLKDAN